MDTVKGSREKGKVFLTIIFRDSSFMLIFLMKDGTQASVIQVFDALTDMLGMAYSNGFSQLYWPTTAWNSKILNLLNLILLASLEQKFFSATL